MENGMLKRNRRRTSWWSWGVLCCVVAGGLLVGCGDEAEEWSGADSTGVEVGDGGDSVAESTPAVDPAQNSPEAWLADRYGPESGVVELVVESEGEETRQVRYFRDHGRTEALYWYAFGDDNTPHVTITKNDSVYFRGPADPAPQVQPWTTSLPIAIPNFRNLNDAMTTKYGLKEIEGRTILGREAHGYELRSGPVVSRVWTWEGVMLYGEIDGHPGENIKPITIRATDLQVDADIPDERFTLVN